MWIVVIMLLVPIWRELHFYAIHRLIHVPTLYKPIHSLHHRNVNPGELVIDETGLARRGVLVRCARE